ncbi:MAG: outer membrane protein assembly factor BamA [Desulfobacteraceae bacterium]|nr:outer membrane protein assembly factor BamA [Desulfobacteraceae bacterium]MCB9494846.1 outer membrane protein assembly factor BamA [Desulfobacteraceae bacterium]
MYRFSVFFILFVFSSILVCIPFEACSFENKVVLFPFQIEGSSDFDYLKKEIPDLIGSEIKKAGGEIYFYENEAHGLKNEDLFNISNTLNSRGFVKGKFAVSGNNIFVLEAVLGNSKQMKSYQFREEFSGIENLFGTVNKIAKKIGGILFEKITISEIEIRGNERIEDEAIKRLLNTKEGSAYADGDLSDDLDRIYNMGYFGDIRVIREETDSGVKIVFDVKEKPTIRQIYFKGNHAYDNEKIKENISLKSGSILNIFEVKKDIEAIKELYKEKNYHQCEVQYELNELTHNRADLTFNISEGDKTFIREIVFEGNNDYSDKQLKKQIESSTKGFFSWLTGSGEFKKDQIQQDAGRILGFYHTTGYAEARVSDPEITFDGNNVKLLFKIFEGDKFTIGNVSAKGDLIVAEEIILEALKTKKGDVFNRQYLQEDSISVSDIYADAGYANADVFPDLEKDRENKILNITFNIKKNNQVYIDKIIIGGNTKTRDKVIRREFPIKEQSLYSKSRLQRGVRNLYRMDYFQNVNLETVPSDEDDKVDIHVNVEEKTTGMFTFGAGYSSVDNLFATVSVTQRNFMGKGQTVNLKGEFSGSATRYTFSFTEPWLFDIPLSAGFDIYNWEREYDDYDKKSTGGSVRFSYPVFDYTRVYWSYTYEVATIDNIDTTDLDILELEGDNVESSTTVALKYDSRDRMFNPTEGMKHSISVEHAGGFLGGDYSYTKYIGETGVYFPLFWNFVFFAHGECGYVKKNSGGILPDYEKFYLGGMNSVRGYDWQGIYVLTDEGNEVGGEKYIQANLELIFPLVKKAGLMGLLFYDAGDVFAKSESIGFDDIRRSWGYGIRWYSPVGPIRLEYGRMLDPDEDENESGRWEFTMGQAF